MGFCCEECGDDMHICTGWDGKGSPAHNLIEQCPSPIKQCMYRKLKKLSAPFESQVGIKECNIAGYSGPDKAFNKRLGCKMPASGGLLKC